MWHRPMQKHQKSAIEPLQTFVNSLQRAAATFVGSRTASGVAVDDGGAAVQPFKTTKGCDVPLGCGWC
jgi:hypothetical protein